MALPTNQSTPDLKSSVAELGEVVTQIYHFKGNVKRTFHHIITSSIKDGSMTKMKTTDGRLLMVPIENLLMIEVIPEN